MSKLDRATEEQVFAFNCDRFTSEVALEAIQSKEYREDFERFISYVLDTVQNLILDYGYGECEFNLDWYEYKGLFPFSISSDSNDFGVYNWIEKTVLVQANSVLRFVKVSISLDGMGFVSHSQWRNNTLCFVMDSVIDERRNQESVG
jgi:hypothetical protein